MTGQTLGAIDRKVMAATNGLLKRWVTEGNLPANYQTEAVMAVMALEQALARDALGPEFEAGLKATERGLADSFRSLFGVRSGGEDEIGAELAATIDAAAQACTVTPESEAHAAQQLRAFLVAWYAPTDPEIDEGIAPIFRPFAVTPDPQVDALIITAAKMQAYCDKRFPERGITVEKVDALRGGYSKGTYIVSTVEAGEKGKFVIRQDRPGLPTGSSVTDEYAALVDIHPACPKAPEPYWVEPDTAPFGAAVMAVDFREGEPGRVFPEDPERRRKWALSTARMIASLHSIRPDQPGDVRAFMAETLRDFRAWRDRIEHTPHPGLAFGLAWLEAHLDDLAGRPVCRTHGDLAYHNILMKDDEVSAALDWEFTQFSDPVEDLAYIRPFIVELGYWDEFLAEWSAGCGLSWDDKAARWFSVFSSVRIALCNLSILHLLLTTDLNDVALLVAGAKLLQKWEVELLDSIMRAEEQTTAG